MTSHTSGLWKCKAHRLEDFVGRSIHISRHVAAIDRC